MQRLSRTSAVLTCLGLSAGMGGAGAQSTVALPAGAPATPAISAKVAAPAVTPSIPAPLPDLRTPEEFFARARQLSDLEAAGIPFHLKATYVASGDAEFTGNGTYEEWWQSKDLWRKEATLGDYKYVAIKMNGAEKDYGTSSYTPLRLRQAFEFSLVSTPVITDDSPRWEVQHQTLKGVDLTVVSSQYQCPRATSPAQCERKEFFTAEGQLGAESSYGIEALFDDFQSFHSLLIPRSINVASSEGTLLTISIQSPDPLGANEEQLLKDADVPTTMRAVGVPIGAKPGPNVKPSKLIRQIAPTYPPDLKLARFEGTVVVEASIDADGNVREPYLRISTGTQLDDAAIDAIRQWKYEPLTIDGVPYSIETTIAVVFSMNR